MRRKDGRPKRKARRTMPEYEHGFRDHPANSKFSGEGHRDAISVVSLFAGCGGLDLGFEGGFEYNGQEYRPLPFRVQVAVDNNPDAVAAYKLNLGDVALNADLVAMPAADLPRADVLLGGFPCQDFSSSGKKQGLLGERGTLFRVLTQYMEEHAPKMVVAENVPHLARLRGGAYLRTILDEFESAGPGYRFQVWNLYGPDYGLSQSRRRLFIVGVRRDLDAAPVPPAPVYAGRHVPIDEALADLESVTDETVTNQSQYFVASRATAGGGQGDHTNQRGRVAYCIRANARGRIQFHYSLDRRLTVRECARLQAFPDQFVFPFSTQRNLTLVGNAVPPILGHAVASELAQYLLRPTIVADGLENDSRMGQILGRQQSLPIDAVASR